MFDSVAYKVSFSSAGDAS